MQKYTPLNNGVNEPITPLEHPPETNLLPNGYAMEEQLNSPLDTTDNASAMAAATKHYTNKTNMAKLQWWNAPTTRITLDPTSSTLKSLCQDDGESLKSPTQEVKEDDNVFSTNIQPKDSPNINQLQQQHHHHHQHHHHYHHSTSDGGTPLSKSASSSRHKLNHLSATSNDRISQKIPVTNQFSIEEDQDQTRQDSQLLLNDFLQPSYI